jgi:hypothetical protein
MAMKKCVAVRLVVIYDSQANWKQGGLPEPPSHPAALLLDAWETCMTHSWPEYTKTPPKIGGISYLLIEKYLKTDFINKNL